MSNNISPMKGRDVSAPVVHIVFDGKRYPMVFSNKAARIAEDIYDEKYGKDIGYYGILDEVGKPKHRALMAVVYAGIVAGGADVTWEEFDDKFSLSNIEGITEKIRKGLVGSLPDEDPAADEDEKNAETTPTE